MLVGLKSGVAKVEDPRQLETEQPFDQEISELREALSLTNGKRLWRTEGRKDEDGSLDAE